MKYSAPYKIFVTLFTQMISLLFPLSSLFHAKYIVSFYLWQLISLVLGSENVIMKKLTLALLKIISTERYGLNLLFIYISQRDQFAQLEIVLTAYTLKIAKIDRTKIRTSFSSLCNLLRAYETDPPS